MNIIIVLNYNDYETTKKYVDIIKNYNSIDKIVVVDNNSTDNSFNKLCYLKDEKTFVVKTPKNGGYAYGNNFGIEFIENEIGNNSIDNIIISNPDVIVSQETIKNLLKDIKLNQNAFAVTALIKNANNKIVNTFAWKQSKLVNEYITCSFIIQYLMKKFFKITKQYSTDILKAKNDLIKVDVLPGCFFIADYKKWKEIGGFDDNTFLYYEEDILFYKAKKKLYDVFVDKSVCIQHMESTSVNKNIKKYSVKEKIHRTSCSYYLKECLKATPFQIGIYKFLHVLFLPERFLILLIKSTLKNKQI